MLKERRYTLSELKSAIKESSEFKPKYGMEIPRGDNTDGDKAAKELQKKASKDQPDAPERDNVDISNNGDYNKSFLDLRFMTEPNQVYKDRVEAQIRGYAGKREFEEHKGDDYGNADFSGNENYLQAAKKRANEFNDDANKIANSGLKSRELEKKGLGSEKKTTFDASGEDKHTRRGDDNVDNNNKEVTNKAKNLNEKRLKVLNFKKTQFLSESHMLKKIPEEYKTDGNKFIMKDMTGTQYVIECKVDPEFGHKTLNVVNSYNKDNIREQFDRMKSLYDYKSSNNNSISTVNERKQEDENLSVMLNKMRTILK